MRAPRILRPTTVVLALLALTGCGPAAEGGGAGQSPEPDQPPRAQADPEPEPELHVVAELAPIADLVGRVGGERVAVSSLVPPGADSHTYEPRPSDVTALSEADAYVGIGLGLNPGAVDLAGENLPEQAVVLLGERYLDEDLLLFDHTHDGTGHDHDGDGHAHDGGVDPNPHVWTGLSVAAPLVAGIADALSELDPAGADGYRERAGRLRDRIEGLRVRVAEAAATIPEHNRTLIVYHDAWSYFARDHDLEMVAAVQPSDHAEPSAGEVRDIIEQIREHDVPALFGSEVFPSDVLEVISEETGAVYVGDLADDELPGEPGDEEHSYLGMMRRNAGLVVEHLGGDAALLRDPA